MTQTVPPQPTTSFSDFSVGIAEAARFPVTGSLGSKWLSSSKADSSIHSARAFQTLAISSHPGPFGRSIWLIRFHANSDSDESRCRLDRMILIPSSLTQVTYFPDKDHLIVLMAPSPLCRIVSFPLPVLNPMDPSQLEAVAVALPIVVAFELTPTRPPIVRINSPARPPEMYDRSFL